MKCLYAVCTISVNDYFCIIVTVLFSSTDKLKCLNYFILYNANIRICLEKKETTILQQYILMPHNSLQGKFCVKVRELSEVRIHQNNLEYFLSLFLSHLGSLFSKQSV